MTSTIIPTLKCCIDSMQLKLSGLGLEKIDFERILEEKLSITEPRRNVNKSLMQLSDNHFEYLNPICPYCNSNKVIKQEFREINLIIDDSRL